LEFIVPLSFNAVGALIKRPLQNCNAILKISKGNNPIITVGNVILFQNQRAINDRPYGLSCCKNRACISTPGLFIYLRPQRLFEDIPMAAP
jgi:hypothetical protein